MAQQICHYGFCHYYFNIANHDLNSCIIWCSVFRISNAKNEYKKILSPSWFVCSFCTPENSAAVHISLANFCSCPKPFPSSSAVSTFSFVFQATYHHVRHKRFCLLNKNADKIWLYLVFILRPQWLLHHKVNDLFRVLGQCVSRYP